MNLIHQKRWSGHHFGSCLIRDDLKLVYINIPKNATEWMKQTFKGKGSNFYKTPIPEDYQFVVILRDPYKRWISGLSEFIKRYSTIPATNITFWTQLDTLKLLSESGATDEHTELQSRFIDDYKNRTTFFRCDNNLATNIKHWSDENNLNLTPSDSPKHQTVGIHLKLSEQIEESINKNVAIRNKILKYLKDDIDLYNSVQYYTKGEE